MKLLYMLLIAAIVIAPASAKETFGKRLWQWSAAALIAGASLDVASSYGRQESVPFLRSADGRFGARGTGLRLGLVTGSLVTQHYLLKRHPESAFVPTLLNFGVGGALGGLAVRNWKLKNEK